MRNDMHPEIPVMEFSQIDAQVIIGTNACCVDHFKIALLDKGVTCDISLEGESLDQPYGVDCFVWLPTQDHTAPSLHNVQVGCAALDQMLAQGRKVYIHCKNGHGRAPTFYCAFLILKRGFSFDQAWNIIKTSRNEAHLDKVQEEFLRGLTVGRR
ncbi:dual specificity protein phosphatase family protein [Candidatus Uhrbacteria bacterium]|nr:dual specificity protein phosphatase family protein [Candidatus Uhrbacteria bacterium]